MRILGGTGPTPTISTLPLGLVPSITPAWAVMMTCVLALALIPTASVRNSPDKALRLVTSSYTTSARRCLRGADLIGVASVGAVLAVVVQVVVVDGLADLFVLGSGEFGHHHAEAGVLLDPRPGFPGPTLTLEGVDALVDQFLFGPLAGVVAERVGQHPVGGFQQGVVGVDGLGTDLLGGVGQRVDMAGGDLPCRQLLLDLRHVGELLGDFGHPLRFAGGHPCALSQHLGGIRFGVGGCDHFGDVVHQGCGYRPDPTQVAKGEVRVLLGHGADAGPFQGGERRGDLGVPAGGRSVVRLPSGASRGSGLPEECERVFVVHDVVIPCLCDSVNPQISVNFPDR